MLFFDGFLRRGLNENSGMNVYKFPRSFDFIEIGFVDFVKRCQAAIQIVPRVLITAGIRRKTAGKQISNDFVSTPSRVLECID